PRNPSRSRKRLLKTALRDNYLEKRRLYGLYGTATIKPHAAVYGDKRESSAYQRSAPSLTIQKTRNFCVISRFTKAHTYVNIFL
ncbi:hypothetical protein, partial [Aeromonas sp. QDB11]|uniref:hypothetical protein n=1 Tax=Aeromonas sp. QDB11 TaxID=2990482 RepID=UPI0022E63AB8